MGWALKMGGPDKIASEPSEPIGGARKTEISRIGMRWLARLAPTWSMSHS